MKKLIRDFENTTDLQQRWRILHQIETHRIEGITAIKKVCKICCPLLILLISVLFWELLWQISFMGHADQSALFDLLSSSGFSWWQIILFVLLGALVVVPILSSIFTHWFWKKNQPTPPPLTGTAAQQAKEVLDKAKLLSENPPDYFPFLWMIAGLLFTVIVYFIDQGDNFGNILISSIVLFFILFIPYMLVCIVPYALAFASILDLTDKKILKSVCQSADAEWVKHDPQEAQRRHEQYLELQRIQEEMESRTHISVPSYSAYSADKGLNTYMTDTRNGQTIYHKDGQYVNESGERVPYQHIDD